MAALPYGGIALWAQTIIGILCLTLAALVYLRHNAQPAGTSSPLARASRYFQLFLVWLFLATLISLLKATLTPSTGSITTIGATLFLWCAWTCLVVSIPRLCRHATSLRTLITGIAIIGTAEAIFGIVGLYASSGVYSVFVKGARAVGTFSSGNSLGGFIALCLPPTFAMTHIAFVNAIRHIQTRKTQILHQAIREDYCLLSAALWLLATLLQSISLLLSGSRGAIIAATMAMLCLAAWFSWNRDERKDRRLPITAAILTVFLLIAIGVGGTYALTISRLQELSAAQETALPRTTIWKAALPLIAQNPLGTGLGCFSAAFTAFQPEGFRGARVYHAHNDYIEIMAEIGIPGFLLLLLFLSILLTTTTRRLLAPDVGNTVWLRRAALLSVAAGLIHAAVDFNLSSRPGVAALFFCLLGVAVSRPARHAYFGRKPEHATPPSVTRNARWKTIVAGMLALLTLNQLRIASATLLMEQGFSAILGESSLYFWLPVPTLTQPQSLHRLRMAARLMPESPQVHLLCARALLLNYDHRLQTMIRKIITDHPELSPQTASTQMRILMRTDEHNALLAARDEILKAKKRTPDSPDVSAHYAIITARLASLTPDLDDRVSDIRHAIELTKQTRLLAPNDATVNRQLLGALGMLSAALFLVDTPALLEEAQSTSIDIGKHLLHLGEEDIDNILQQWSRLHIEPFDVFGGAPLPMDAAWKLYRFYARQNQAASALKALDGLEQSIKAETLSGAGFRSNQKETLTTKHRHLLIRERAKWQLRLMQFDAYRHASDAHAATLSYDIAQQLNRSTSRKSDSARFYYLNLQRLWQEWGLDPKHTQEYVTLMTHHGETEAAIAKILSQITFFAETYPDSGSRTLTDVDTTTTHHRINLINARRALRDGNTSVARDLIIEAFENQPTDPDIIEFLINNASVLAIDEPMMAKANLQLQKTTPDYVLNVQFLGGRIELVGISLAGKTIESFWRFRSAVPSDIDIVFLFREREGAQTAAISTRFTKAFGREFGVGNPPLGSVFKAVATIPPTAILSENIILGLRHVSTSRWLRSSEGLLYCEIYNWQTLYSALP